MHPQTGKLTKVTKMAGVTQTKPPFAKNTVFTTPIFCPLTGKKKAYTALLQYRTFLCWKKWGPQSKEFSGRYACPGFYRVFVSTTGLESFSWKPEKFSKRISLGGGSVRFFLLCPNFGGRSGNLRRLSSSRCLFRSPVPPTNKSTAWVKIITGSLAIEN